MSKPGGGEVIEMQPLSMRGAERIGELLLQEFQPEALERPTAIDVADWVENKLEKYGIYVYPEPDAALPEVEAYTDPDESTREVKVIACRESVYESLMAGGRRSVRHRATLLHELAHALIHIPQILDIRAQPAQHHLLARKRWEDVPTFCNAEWQAWAIAGCIAMPRRTLIMLNTTNPAEVAEAFGVSADFATSHMKRLKMIPR